MVCLFLPFHSQVNEVIMPGRRGGGTPPLYYLVNRKSQDNTFAFSLAQMVQRRPSFDTVLQQEKGPIKVSLCDNTCWHFKNWNCAECNPLFSAGLKF